VTRGGAASACASPPACRAEQTAALAVELERRRRAEALGALQRLRQRRGQRAARAAVSGGARHRQKRPHVRRLDGVRGDACDARARQPRDRLRGARTSARLRVARRGEQEARERRERARASRFEAVPQARAERDEERAEHAFARPATRRPPRRERVLHSWVLVVPRHGVQESRGEQHGARVGGGLRSAQVDAVGALGVETRETRQPRRFGETR
jgi:hypothetical protein